MLPSPRIDIYKILLSDEVISWSLGKLTSSTATWAGINGPWNDRGRCFPSIIVHRGPAVTHNKSYLMDRINEVWCSDAFAPKFVLRKVSSVIQGHNYWSYDGITINRYVCAVFGPAIYIYLKCPVLCLYARAGVWHSTYP